MINAKRNKYSRLHTLLHTFGETEQNRHPRNALIISKFLKLSSQFSYPTARSTILANNETDSCPTKQTTRKRIRRSSIVSLFILINKKDDERRRRRRRKIGDWLIKEGRGGSRDPFITNRMRVILGRGVGDEEERKDVG